MSQPWWVPVVQWTVWGIVITLVMGWVARSRNRPRSTAEGRQLAHPPSTLIIGLVGFSFFLGIAVISNVYPNKTTTLLTTSFFLGFAALSLPMIADFFLARHEVTDEGLNYGRITGRRGSLKWSQVSRLRYEPVMKWFKVETASGQVARVSAMLVGLPEFARTVLVYVPPTAIDAQTHAVLEATAAGNPPKVWG